MNTVKIGQHVYFSSINCVTMQLDSIFTCIESDEVCDVGEQSGSETEATNETEDSDDETESTSDSDSEDVSQKINSVLFLLNGQTEVLYAYWLRTPTKLVI